MSRLLTFLLGCSAVFVASGCGAKTSPVSGTVTLDGKAVSGATVVFTSEADKVVASGVTDDEGRYSLTYQNGTKIPAGSYKVSVLKTKIIEGQAPGAPEDKAGKAYLDQMKKELGKGGPPKLGPAVKTGEPNKADSLLPAVYSAASSTPISAQVPAPSDTFNIELKSKQ